MPKDEKNKQSEPMSYEVVRAPNLRRQYLDAIDRDEATVELPAETVERVEIANPASPPKSGKKEG